ncbi:hypothetical protein GCM10007049_11510 [Echinicola pacifica]|uniref:phospholipase D n=1 Tax=Echinicola pacifica TaxID=346377 RepID=A0A918UMI8_9BACT|nr:phospholipase D-like domain-containing protein [Echinicola pacifica]GGZ20630.1 hypothetical protein GCM10007049_11510 [Echinicola pacifica]
MNTLDHLLDEFKISLEDHALSRSEKREIKSEVADLTMHERQVLMSDICQLAQARTQDVDTQNLLQWFYEAVKLLQQKETATAYGSAFFSPGNACRDAIIQELRMAQSIIHICVFTISDNQITNEIIEAQRRNIPIKIISDDEKVFDLGSDIDLLREEGLAVQTDHSPAHMHHKFAIFDRKKVLTGSYNWTRSAASQNYENIVLLDDVHTVRTFEKEFDRLWDRFESGRG